MPLAHSYPGRRATTFSRAGDVDEVAVVVAVAHHLFLPASRKRAFTIRPVLRSSRRTSETASTRPSGNRSRPAGRVRALGLFFTLLWRTFPGDVLRATTNARNHHGSVWQAPRQRMNGQSSSKFSETAANVARDLVRGDRAAVLDDTGILISQFDIAARAWPFIEQLPSTRASVLWNNVGRVVEAAQA